MTGWTNMGDNAKGPFFSLYCTLHFLLLSFISSRWQQQIIHWTNTPLIWASRTTHIVYHFSLLKTHWIRMKRRTQVRSCQAIMMRSIQRKLSYQMEMKIENLLASSYTILIWTMSLMKMCIWWMCAMTLRKPWNSTLWKPASKSCPTIWERV